MYSIAIDHLSSLLMAYAAGKQSPLLIITPFIITIVEQLKNAAYTKVAQETSPTFIDNVMNTLQ